MILAINGILKGGVIETVGVSTLGLILYLDASNPLSYPGTGTLWNDLSTANNDGNLLNGASYSSSNSGVISLDSTDDYVDCGTGISSRGPQALTVSFWIKPSVYTGDVKFIINLDYYAPYPIYFGAWINMWNDFGNGTYRLEASVGDGVFLYSQNRKSMYSTDGILVADSWKNITVVWENAQVAYIYCNGVPVSTYVGGGYNGTNLNWSGAGVAKIGNTTGSTAPDQINDVLVYERALTATEVLNNYNDKSSKYL